MPHPQFILAVENETLIKAGLTGVEQELHVLQVQDFLPHIQGGIVIGQREALEVDESKRQILPYITLTKKIDGVQKFFAYRRGKGVGESRLSGNVSIGVGGHIDLADVVHTGSVIDTMSTVITAVTRELGEEIEFTGDGDVGFNSIGAIVENTNAVGRVHMALSILGIVSEDTEVKCAEEELETLGWFTAKELLNSGLPLENWTKILCNFLAENEE